MKDKVIKFKVASDKLHTAIERLSFKIPNDDFEFGWNKALEKLVLTLIDKI